VRQEFRYSMVAGLGGGLLGTSLATTRVERIDAEACDALRAAGRSLIFVLWHGRLLPLSYHHRHWNLVTLISASSDGEYIARVVQRWGYDVVRGSSSRGGSEALRQLVRHCRAGRSLAITPDGPRGPRQTMKPGPLLVAQLTGAPLLPIAAGTERAWWFEGWDRFLVPQPFARIRVVYGEPVFVPRAANEDALAEIAADVEERINRVTERADTIGDS
jgi:lysophospholipid acyltransferase (LPLAT)-like uncharacterized protein